MVQKTNRINKSKTSIPPAHPWHAVAIKPKGANCCDAVQACRNARFLSGEAPRLPLPECTNTDGCSCVYKHHADRRGSDRREQPAEGLRRNAVVAQDRRLSRDRRNQD